MGRSHKNTQKKLGIVYQSQEHPLLDHHDPITLYPASISMFHPRSKSQGLQCQCSVHFSTEQLMWPVLKGPKGLDQPRRLLSTQSWTSQLQLQLWQLTHFIQASILQEYTKYHTLHQRSVHYNTVQCITELYCTVYSSTVQYTTAM